MFYAKSDSVMMISEDEFGHLEGPPMSPTSSQSTSLSSPRSNHTFVPGVGLSNPQLSHGRRKMLDLVNKLHSTGCVPYFYFCPCAWSLEADFCGYRVQVDIDLPQIAVIGSQSAGKSSLIESISGITLPRAAGTCTRYFSHCSESPVLTVDQVPD